MDPKTPSIIIIGNTIHYPRLTWDQTCILGAAGKPVVTHFATIKARWGGSTWFLEISGSFLTTALLQLLQHQARVARHKNVQS